MQELGLIPLVNHDVGRFANSALPGSPVVPEPQPGWFRVRAAGALHRLADRLDHGPTHAPRWTRERTA